MVGLAGDYSMKTIPLTRGMVTIVDDWNYTELARYKWHARRAKAGLFYAARGEYIPETQTTKQISMHRHILRLNRGDGIKTDHINHNGLDNREENLRTCTVTQNNHNLRTHRDNVSGLKGVIKNGNGFSSQIMFNRKNFYLGYYDTAEEAHAAYWKAAKKFYGEFACEG